MDGPAPSDRDPGADSTGSWPRISDYWPGEPAAPAEPAREPTGSYPLLSGAAGHAYRDDLSGVREETPPPPPEAPDLIPYPEHTPAPELPPEPRRPRLRLAATLAVVVVLLGVSGVVAFRLAGSETTDPGRAAAPPEKAAPPVSDRPESPVFVEPAPPESPPPADRGPAFDAGTFDLASNVAELNLTLGRPADGPIRVSTPAGSGIKPATAVGDDTVRLTAEPTGTMGSARLDVLLDERIAWTIRMNGGVRKATFVLTRGTVREVDLSGGADTVYLALPGSDGALPIRMSGGVREWSIRTEKEVPVRVRVRDGGGEVSLYGKRKRGIDRGTTLTAGDGSGLEVTAKAGFGKLAVSSP